MAGILSTKQCFTETEIVTRATAIYEAAEWNWFYDNDQGLLHMRWTPDNGHEFYWEGYNEAMILYLLAIGSPTYPIPATAWDSWADSYQDNWGAYYGYPILTEPALFTHQYSHIWIDFRNQRDAYANYFQNSIYATLANRAYSKDIWYPEPAVDLWGITASDAPADNCQETTYRGSVSGYPPDTGMNDGTIAPTAAGGSIIFTPQHSISTLRFMYENYPRKLWGLFGLKDALNARCEPIWFDNDYIGIDVGAMLLMIENHRSDLVWNIFMGNQGVITAMKKVGFSPDVAQEPAYFYYREIEDYDLISGTNIVSESHDTAWNRGTLQIDSGTEPHPGNQAVYTFTVGYKVGSDMLFEIRYSDDIAGDLIDIYLDGAKKGSFTTDEFEPGGWDSFGWDNEQVNLGTVSPGVHTITLKMADENEGINGLYGVNLDVFRIFSSGCVIFLSTIEK